MAKYLILISFYLFGFLLTQAEPQQTSGGSLPTPSLEDEKNTYRRWGWRGIVDKEPRSVTEPIPGYSVSNPDIHGDTEGDDLWSYLMMYRRTGNKVYYNRAAAWAKYFKNDYRQCVGTRDQTYCYDRRFLWDHMYGWGLVAWYEYTGDTAALAAAENLASDVEGYWSVRVDGHWPVPGQFSMAYYGMRQGARHLLLATRVAEATQKARWITLRDRLINLWLLSPDWDSRGMYFLGDYETDTDLGAGKYANGAREQSSYHTGVLAEAFYQAYRTTGQTGLKNKLIAMARYVDQYGLSPSSQYTGRRFGIVNGSARHNYDGGAFCDPVYSTSLVNTLVLGYKYTGERNLYDRARYFFNRGTKGVYGSCTQRSASDRQIHHFVDTQFASATGYFYLDNNKGELQYTYLLFGNGGNPFVEYQDVTPPAPPKGVTVIK